MVSAATSLGQLPQRQDLLNDTIEPRASIAGGASPDVTMPGATVRQLESHQTCVEGVDVWWCLAEAAESGGSEAEALPAQPLRWWLEHPALSPDERLRVSRFAHSADAWAFAAARIELRAMLSRVLGDVPAEKVPIEVGARGKPGLVGRVGPAFNLTHTVDLSAATGWRALVAVAVGGAGVSAVGIDVERVDRFSQASLVERFFTDGERHALAKVAPGLQPAHRAALWTCKEAFVKATGTGIAGQFGNFEVSVGDDVRLVRWQTDDGTSWRFNAIDVPTQFRAFLVAGRP